MLLKHRRIDLNAMAVLGSVLLSMSGCPQNSPEVPPSDPPVSPPGDPVNPVVDPPFNGPSTNNRVKFKGGKRIATDLAAALNLSRDTLCRELGTLDCVEAVHSIPLGGVEPYERGILEPMKQQSVTSINALDRLALQACQKRADLDFKTPAEAVVFAELALSDKPDAQALPPAVRRLYQKLLHRNENKVEAAALTQFYAALKIDPAPSALGVRQVFASMACYALATSEEAAFY